MPFSSELSLSNELQACKDALQKLGPLMKSDNINRMFQKHLDPTDSLLYPDFLNDLCKHIVSIQNINHKVINLFTMYIFAGHRFHR